MLLQIHPFLPPSLFIRIIAKTTKIEVGSIPGSATDSGHDFCQITQAKMLKPKPLRRPLGFPRS